MSDEPDRALRVRPQRGPLQMAAALLDAPGRARSRCVGRQRARRPVNPAVVEAMPSSASTSRASSPKLLTDEVVRAADVVITMGCGDACPVYPGKRYLDWELDDPAGQAGRRGPADPRRDRPPRPAG